MFKKIILISYSIFFIEQAVNAQTFLNGSFDINTCPAGVDQINLTGAGYNAFMTNSWAFGTYGTGGDMDILTLATYGLPQNGSWYVALTGGGTDMISMKLGAPLVTGNSYTITFYDRAYVSFPAQPVEIGLSTVNNAYGTFMASTGVVPTNSIWTLRTMSFVAPNNGQYLTVRTAGVLGNWTQIDHFAFVVVLPVELLELTSKCQNNSVTIEWSAISKNNNELFSVERSQNAEDYTQLGELKTSDNINKKANYSFIDYKPLNGLAYYRLKHTGLDKNVSYSNVISVEGCDPKLNIECQINPNPTSDYLNVTIKNFDANTKLKIVSSLGNPVYESSIESGSKIISLSDLEAGVYLIHVISDGGVVTKKFTKN